MNINERIQFLLTGRRGKELIERYDLDKNLITRLKKGANPTWRNIHPLVLCENVNADWLISGYGQPYRTHHWADAAQLHTAVKAVIEEGSSPGALDTKWEVYLIKGLGLIAHQIATWEVDDNTRNPFALYQAHIGPVGANTLQLLQDKHVRVNAPGVSTELIGLIKSGQIGAYGLFGYPLDDDNNAPLAQHIDWLRLKGEQMAEAMMVQATSTVGSDKFTERLNQLDEKEAALVEGVIIQLLYNREGAADEAASNLN